MKLRPLDTTREALEKQRSAFARLGPEGRVRAALEMSDSVRAVRLAGLRSRHPGHSQSELLARLIADAYGVRLPSDR